MLFKIEDVTQLRATPAVNGLVVIANDADVTVERGEAAEQFELEGIGILVLVYQDVGEVSLVVGEGGGTLVKEAQGEEEEVFEIHGVSGTEGGVVAFPDAADDGGIEVIVLSEVEVIREWRARIIDSSEDVFSAVFFPGDGDGAESFFDEGELVVGVVDREVGAQAEYVSIFADDAETETVEGRDLHCVHGATDERADAVQHFTGGFIGEGESEDIGGGNAVMEHVGDAVSDGTGFSGTGAGEDEDGAADGLDSGALLRVKVVEE